MASSRAAASESMPCVRAASWKPWLDWLTAFAFQNRAIAVCSSERAESVADPYALISLNSLAHVRLDSAGGGSARYCAALRSMNGFMTASHGVWATCSDGSGGNVQLPGVKGPGVNVI